MPNNQFSIRELAEKSRITIRTIRYYTEEGLLPPPINQGKYAYYTHDHLNRLDLIRRMKEAYLPLREIRQVMLSLTEEEVDQRLSEQVISLGQSTRETNSVASPASQSSNALEYISRLMNEQEGYRPKGVTVSNQSLRQLNKNEPPPGITQPSNAPQSQPVSENWQRIPLVSGVELHLRTPADPDVSDRVEQLISFALKLFRRP